MKELRETRIGLKLILKLKIYPNEEDLNLAIKENNELISIFVATINTMKGKNK